MLRLLTNFTKNAEADVRAFMRISGLKGEIHDEATSLIGEPLKDYHSLWYDVSIDQSEAVSRYFYCASLMDDKLQELYRSQGVPEALYKGKFLYRGCEKDYFPEYNIIYPSKEHDL